MYLALPGAHTKESACNAMQETQVWSLVRKIPLEEGMVTHSGILAWRIPWTEEPSGLPSLGLQQWGTRLSNFHDRSMTRSDTLWTQWVTASTWTKATGRHPTFFIMWKGADCN